MQLKIKTIKNYFNKYFSLILKKPENFHFYPGQYLDIKLPVKDPNGDTRAFTISSSPTEDFLMVTVKKGLSPFKKSMCQLKIEEEIETSHPAGTFTLDESTPAIFFAGGVGITPFRSMIKHAHDNQFKTQITLIYSHSDDNFLFKDELDQWQKKLSNLTINYFNTSQKGRLTKDIIHNSRFQIHNSVFYLAGSHQFVNDLEKTLLTLGIDQTDIRYDRFDGY